jgi:hypothetical protein
MVSGQRTAWLLLDALVCSACVGHPAPVTSVGGFSPTLNASTYYEEGTQVSVIVGTRPAQFRRERTHVPFEIALVNKGLASLTVTPESFTLVDSKNNRYPVVGSAELAHGYGSTDVDRRLAEVASILERKYPQYERVRSNFTPGFVAPIGSKSVVLPRFGYLVDLVYFPNPEVPMPPGPYELLVQVAELPQPLVVHLSVGKPSSRHP